MSDNGHAERADTAPVGVSEAMIVALARTSDLPVIGALNPWVAATAERATALTDAVTLGHCWTARRGEYLVGYAVCAPSFFGEWFIAQLFVHPDARRRGVATQLIRHCEAVCAARKLFISTNASNLPMQRLLDSLGYDRSGYVENLDADDPELIYINHLQAATD